MASRSLQEISHKSCNTVGRWVRVAAAIFTISAAISTAAAQTSADLNPLTPAAAMPRVQSQDSGLSSADADASSGQCSVHVIANDVIVSDHEREEVGFNVQPSGIIPDPGAWPYFAWSDTELGVVRSQDGSGYLFFGSDGGCHENCDNPNGRAGSITVSHGTLDHPLGTPLDDPNPPVYEFVFPVSDNLPMNINYAGGGPVYRVPNGEPGAGSLLIVYHIERNANPFWSWSGIAKSVDEGMTWQDLGRIISVPHAYDANGAADIGDNALVPYTDPATQQKYFYIFFPHHCWTSSTAQCSDFTAISVARAPYEELLSAAAAGSSLSKMFLKYYNGEWNQPGLLGLASETFPGVTGETDGDYQIVWSDYRDRFIAMMDNGEYIAYGESVDGTYWPPMQVLYREPNPNGTIGYANAVGLGEDPGVVGNTFYSYYTDEPVQDNPWQPATLNRLTITTAASTISAQPNVATAGGPAFTLAMFGEHFTKEATVMWNNSPRATTFANSTLLYAQIPASDIASAGNAKVTVETPAPCGGRSNGQVFSVLP